MHLNRQRKYTTVVSVCLLLWFDPSNLKLRIRRAPLCKSNLFVLDPKNDYSNTVLLKKTTDIDSSWKTQVSNYNLLLQNSFYSAILLNNCAGILHGLVKINNKITAIICFIPWTPSIVCKNKNIIFWPSRAI